MSSSVLYNMNRKYYIFKAFLSFSCVSAHCEQKASNSHLPTNIAHVTSTLNSNQEKRYYQKAVSKYSYNFTVFKLESLLAIRTAHARDVQFAFRYAS